MANRNIDQLEKAAGALVVTCATIVGGIIGWAINKNNKELPEEENNEQNEQRRQIGKRR